MAIKEYREAVRLDPDYVPARTNLGVAYQEQGRLRWPFRNIAKRSSLTRAMPWPMRIWPARLPNRKMQAALLEYQEALRLNPRDAEVHFALGGLYENKNRPDLAMKEYRAAIESNRDLAPAYSALGWMLFDQSPGRGHGVFQSGPSC